MASVRVDPPLKSIRMWLYVCCGLVFTMVLLGGDYAADGIRPVHGPLWRPVTGWLPPISDAAWAALFDAYRDLPEFRKLNFWMGLEDFKRIFWLEYLHRLLGRILGVVYLLPFLWFLMRYRLPAGLIGRLAILFVLGGAQGTPRLVHG